MILHRYFAMRFLRTLAATFAMFLAMTLLIDLVEQARRFGGSGAGFGALAALSALNLPQSIYGILPLILIIATIALFLGLARSSELVVTRAAGRSALRALVAPVVVAFLLGALALAFLNPLVAATSRAYEARLGDLRGERSVLALSDDGLWLRQGGTGGQTVIRADRANLDGTVLSGVTFLTFDADGAPERRIEAARAELGPDGWTLHEAKSWPLRGAPNPEVQARLDPTLVVGSTLTADQIRDSFGTPSSIPIWDLPAFIERLQAAGFSALRHQVWFQMELAQPLFLVAMVLIGAAFTMRHQRGGRTGLFVLIALLLSFGVYFLRNFAQILGENGEIPAALAAWAPPAAALAFALGLILHLEDG